MTCTEVISRNYKKMPLNREAFLFKANGGGCLLINCRDPEAIRIGVGSC